MYLKDAIYVMQNSLMLVMDAPPETAPAVQTQAYVGLHFVDIDSKAMSREEPSRFCWEWKPQCPECNTLC